MWNIYDNGKVFRDIYELFARKFDVSGLRDDVEQTATHRSDESSLSALSGAYDNMKLMSSYNEWLSQVLERAI